MLEFVWGGSPSPGSVGNPGERHRAARLQYNGRTVYTFRMEDILMEAMKGSTEFTMSRGSFKIRSQESQTRPLRIAGLVAEGTGAEAEAFKILRVSLDLDMETARGQEPCCITFTVSRPDHLEAHIEGVAEAGFNRMRFRIPALEEEYVYGCGEIFPRFNLRGRKVNNWVAEHINVRTVAKKLVQRAAGLKDRSIPQPFSAYETYFAQPTFLSSRKYYFHSATTARSVFDFTDKDYHLICQEQIADFCFGFADSFAGVLEDMSLTLGRQPRLPEWVYDGEILGIQGGTDTMMGKLENVLAHGMAVAGIWIQDWQGRRITAAGKQLYWNWKWEEELYPGLDVKIRELKERGIRVLGYCNPFLAVEKPLYKEASAKGYCVKNRQGQDYYVTITTFPAAMVDLTNPEAYEWLKGIIEVNMIGLGLSGWMADFGEYLPTDAVLFDGSDPKLQHNTWPARWAKLNREALEETGKVGEIMFFMRAGFTGSQRYSTMTWNGDNHVDFSRDYGMPSVIPAMLSLTCSGSGLSHSDIGGYTSFSILKRSEELYMRWCEMNTFSPVLRGHEGLNPDLNAQFDASEEVLEHSARMSRIHRSLKPYLMECDRVNSETGLGVVRPLFFSYDEPDAYEESSEYLLGPDVLVAPVLKSGADTREVYLPKDRWLNFFTGQEYSGGHYLVAAPIGRPPVFVRADGAVKPFTET